MAVKREGGKEFPAAAFLHVPDPEKPSTWKLRIWEDEEKKVTSAQLGKAAALLGPGFRGRRVELAEDERRSVLRRLRTHFREAGVDSKDYPSVLKEAMHAEAVRYAARKMAKERRRKAMREGQEDDPETLLAEIVEAYLSLDYFSAVFDGSLSYESIIGAVAAGLSKKHKEEHMTGDEYSSSHSWSCSMRLVSTFPGSCVYEMMAKMYQVSYSLSGTEAVIGSDDVEVTAEFSPAASVMTEQADLWEPFSSGSSVTLSEAKINKSAGVISGAVLLNKTSSNGSGGGGREYTETAMRRMAHMIEGMPIYANHTKDKADAFKPRDVRDLLGVHKNVRFDADRQRIMSDMHIAEHQRGWVFSLAEEMPNSIGLSPVAKGLVRMQGNKEIVEDIAAVRSGDLVTDPATTKGLFEHQEQWRVAHLSGGGKAMALKLDEILAVLSEDKALAAAVRERVAGEELKTLVEAVEGKKAGETALAAEKTAHEATKKLLVEAQAKVEGFQAADALRAKERKLSEAIEGSDLGKKFGKIPDAISPKFRQLLLEAREEDWGEIIGDRVKLLLAAASGGQPESRGKVVSITEGREVPAGAHGRLAAAFR